MAKVPRIVLLEADGRAALVNHHSWAQLPQTYLGKRGEQEVVYVNTGKRWKDTSIDANVYIEQFTDFDLTPYVVPQAPTEAQVADTPITKQEVESYQARPQPADTPADQQFVMKAMLYYLNWSTRYMRAMREGDTKKLNKLEKEWNPEKDLLGK